MSISRRRLLTLGAMAGAGLALPLGALSLPVARMVASASIRSPVVEPFRVPLPVPPVLEPVRKDGGTDHYEVAQRAASQEILPGLKTEVWGYEGAFPGPTVEARSARPVVIRQTNALPAPVSVHLHGGKTPPESDGYPTDLILPSDHDHPSHAHADPHGGDVPGEEGAWAARTTATPTTRGRRPSGTTTTQWTSRDRRSTRACSACTCCATRSRTRCRCRGARRTCRSSSATEPSWRTAPSTTPR